MEDYILLNSMQGSFHQRNIDKFGDTAGKQFACMVHFAIAYVNFRKLNIWRNCDLDIILINGDQLYKTLNRTNYLSVNDLPDRFQIGSVQVQVEYNINNYGILMCNAVSREGLAYTYSVEPVNNLKTKMHCSSCKVFVLPYFSGITLRMFLIHTVVTQHDF